MSLFALALCWPHATRRRVVAALIFVALMHVAMCALTAAIIGGGFWGRT